MLNKLPYSGDREELKASVVRQYTFDRTDSLKEMTDKEYAGCIGGLEKITGEEKRKEAYRDMLRKMRSESLTLMQEMGVDTTDGTRVNNFVQHPRIAGKPFAQISLEELEALQKKLRAIKKRGGLKKAEREEQKADNTEPRYMLIDLGKGGEA